MHPLLTEYLDALGQLLPDAAFFAVDGERRIVAWSKGAEALLGFSAADVMGQGCLTANRCHTCMVGCGLSEYGRIQDVPITLFSSDGRAIRVRKSAVALHHLEGAGGAFVGGVELLVPEGVPASLAPLDPIVRGGGEEVRVFHGLASADSQMFRVFDTVGNVARTDISVLIRGESGTGKELVARAIHDASPRASGPFVAVNGAALTATLAESELFGHVRGAFTGAVRDHRGLFEQAEGGTLFLDEVAELPLAVQAKLLRVLETRTVTPVGGSRAVPVDIRVLSATHKSLRQQVQEGRFREDLMYRLRVVPLYLPPLRARRRDIEVLVRRFMGTRNLKGVRVIDSVAPDAMQALLDHSWPGNVRELRNAVDYAFAVGRGPELLLRELPPEIRDPERVPHFGVGPAAINAPMLVAPNTPLNPPATAQANPRYPAPRRELWETALDPDAAEAARIRRALSATGGHQGKAAVLLGISRATLWRHRKRLNL